MGDFTRSKMVEMRDGLYLLEIEIPHDFISRRLRDLDIRNRFQVEVVMVKRATGKERPKLQTPTAQTIFQPGDVLLILGDKRHVEAFSRV